MSVLSTNKDSVAAADVGRDMSLEAAFSLDITPYKSLGAIANIDLMAHKALGEDMVCLYLRKMDLVEYEIIQKEHYVAKKAWNLSGPAITGGVIAAITGIGILVFGDIRSFVGNVVIPGGAGLVVGGAHAWVKIFFETGTDRAE